MRLYIFFKTRAEVGVLWSVVASTVRGRLVVAGTVRAMSVAGEVRVCLEKLSLLQGLLVGMHRL